MKKELIELGTKLCNIIGDTDISNSDNEIVLDGKTYAFEQMEELDWDDQGKYQNGGTIFRVGIADKECTWYIAEDGYLDLYIEQDCVRYGDYWSGYDYEYDKPYLVEKKEIIKHIWSSVKVK